MHVVKVKLYGSSFLTCVSVYQVSFVCLCAPIQHNYIIGNFQTRICRAKILRNETPRRSSVSVLPNYVPCMPCHAMPGARMMPRIMDELGCANTTGAKHLCPASASETSWAERTRRFFISLSYSIASREGCVRRRGEGRDRMNCAVKVNIVCAGQLYTYLPNVTLTNAR